VAAIRACHERLARDLGAHHRDVIVALGATAIRAVTGLREFPITRAGPRTELPSDWGKVVPTFHPAYILRRGLKGQEMRRLVADLEHARTIAGL
jgi:uracil-DNA glycosylase